MTLDLIVVFYGLWGKPLTRFIYNQDKFFVPFFSFPFSAGTEQIIHWLTGEIFHYYSSLNKIKLFEQIQLFLSPVLKDFEKDEKQICLIRYNWRVPRMT